MATIYRTNRTTCHDIHQYTYTKSENYDDFKTAMMDSHNW